MYTLIRDMAVGDIDCLECEESILAGEDIFVIRKYELLQTARTLIGDEQLESNGLESILHNHYEDIPEELGSSYHEVVGVCASCAIERMSKFIPNWKPPNEYGQIRFGVDFTK